MKFPAKFLFISWPISLVLALCVLSSLAKCQKFDLEAQSTKTILSELNSVSFQVENDPFYKRTQNYFGYSLPELLTALHIEIKEDSALRFHCKDGFKAILVPGQIDMTGALLASKQLTISNGSKMEPIGEGKTSVDPGPFNLIWRGNYSNKVGEPWPHGVVAIEHGTIEEFLGRAYPKKSPQHVAGFQIFQDKCSSCHSVNLQGGVVGPELNVPKNVTEYWRKEDFFGFVSNPQSYRFKSRMSIGPVEEKDIQKIYGYLQAMKDEKVCESYLQCVEWEASLPPPSNTPNN